MNDRRFDIVVFGATSFVGQILCRYLVERHGCDGALRWAIAGRDARKLERVATETGATVDRLVVDARDDAALADLAGSTRVLVSTVGPYALYGSPVVAAAVAAGTDYCDLTGEPQWMRAMIDAHAGEAERTGARIVHACGFDSIPSDLGVWFTQQQAVERFGVSCERISMRVGSTRGGVSGGTIASAMNLLEEASRDRDLRRMLADPYALAPADARTGPSQPDLMRPAQDDMTGQWIAPFVMASVNTRVVHRSHALLGRPWGPMFRYDEAVAMGSGPVGAVKAGAFSGGLGAFMGLTAIGPIRRALHRFVLPKPGSGPSPRTQEAGHFELRFHGRTSRGDVIETQVRGKRDPGYGATARMLGEAADCLVHLDRAEVPGGFWTPATAFGDRLVERLEANADISFRVLAELGG